MHPGECREGSSLPNTGRKIHMEVSFVVHFRFVEPVLQ